MSLRDRVIGFRRVPVADLAPHPKNWRKHPKGQQRALQGLLEEVGFAGAVLARQKSDGTLMLIDGHLRKDLLPGEEIPVLVTDLSEEEAEKVLATFDPIGYIVSREFRCRRCSGLAYRTQHENLDGRLLIKAERLWKRAGCEFGGDGEKPKWMQRRTFHRLMERAEDAYAGSWQTPKIQRLLSRAAR